MARTCEICGKGRVSGNKISHSNRHSRRTWEPNLKRVKAMINGTVKRINVCTGCLRSGRVKRAL
ncbi:MAG: 50S ribosomal protein L28 [Candidatus Alkaliphilus sp. MAG34]|nr:50S ribosomal protein L28 [Clostridiales bacterium]